LSAQPDRRPLIITRAGYAGLQRHALVWTGDNDSSWEHLADSIQMLLNLSLSGVAFCGADVGGFHHNTTSELLARWTQLASFTPFFRNHSKIDTIDQEPWAFGPRIEAICRRFIELRYQLLPYLYSLFVEAHRSGAPIIRPLFWHDQNDPSAVAAGDQFLLGRELMVAPILRQGATARSVYLPVDTWFDFWTGEALRGGRHILAEAGLETMPLFVRSGAVLPMVAVRQFVDETQPEIVNLHVWPGTDGALHWREDDGISFARDNGVFFDRQITHVRRRRVVQLAFSAPSGTRPSAVKFWRIILRNASRPARPRLAGRRLPVRYDAERRVCVFELANMPESFTVAWPDQQP
jgi:alpha-glucosidase